MGVCSPIPIHVSVHAGVVPCELGGGGGDLPPLPVLLLAQREAARRAVENDAQRAPCRVGAAGARFLRYPQSLCEGGREGVGGLSAPHAHVHVHTRVRCACAVRVAGSRRRTSCCLVERRPSSAASAAAMRARRGGAGRASRPSGSSGASLSNQRSSSGSEALGSGSRCTSSLPGQRCADLASVGQVPERSCSPSSASTGYGWSLPLKPRRQPRASAWASGATGGRVGYCERERP